MTQFLVLVEQAAEGCDYTIGCGLAAIFMNGSCTEEIAQKIIIDLERQKEYGDFVESADNISRIRILEISSIQELDINAIREHVHEKERARLKIETDKKELAEYERLKKKWGNK